jgi:lysophospholipase L1-like esterase
MRMRRINMNTLVGKRLRYPYDDMIKLGMMGEKQYYQKVKNLFGSSLIAHYSLDEASGVVAIDKSGNGCDGVYTAVSYRNMFKGMPWCLFSNDTSKLNIYSTTFNSNFDGNTGSISFAFFVPNTEYLTDGVSKYLLRIRVDANNYIYIYKSTNDYLFRIEIMRGGEAEWAYFSVFNTNPNFVTISWDAAGYTLFRNGSVGLKPTMTVNTHTWTGNINTDFAILGAYYKFDPCKPLLASLAKVTFTNSSVSLSQHISMCQYSKVMPKNNIRFTFIGDSIFASYGNMYDLAANYRGGGNIVNNHAIGGSTIADNIGAPASDLTSQVVEATSDDADIIIINLGTNDNNAGDMMVLKAIIGAGISALKISNPRATIYYMNLLPRWTGTDGLTEVDKANLRMAISEQCAISEIACIDTYTDPWILSTDTDDGLHPGAAGKGEVKIVHRWLGVLSA